MSDFIYSASFDAVGSALAVDFFHMTVTSDSPIVLYGMTLGQTTDLGDASEEVLRIGLYRGVTGGTGGTAATEVAYENSAAPVADTAVVTMNTTVSTAGTLMEVITWNIRVPLMWFPIPELRPRIDSAEDPVVFRLQAAPTDTITYSGTVFWAEG
jgi:hypothetical protein